MLRAPRTPRVWLRTACAVVASAGALLFAGSAAADTTHVVQPGQRLGSIAKRYNVSIDALCAANGIRRANKIFPGQELRIPGPAKAGPSKKATATRAEPPTKQAPPASRAVASTPPAPPKKVKGHGHPLVHVVAKGNTLGSIARRYGVSVEAICHASGITQKSVLRLGQQLLVPAYTDPEGEHARSLRLSGRLDPNVGLATWQKYSKAPARRGYVTLQGHSQSWKGYVFGPDRKVLPQARAGISRVLGVRSGGPGIDESLIRLLAQVSDQFGGRPVRIVSGYRETSYVHDSKHKVGRALDFSVPGVPNEAVRDYCRTLGSVGVGYYPNSTFVHLDVRPYPAYWVDYAGPGEPPRLSPHHAPVPARLARQARGPKEELELDEAHAEHDALPPCDACTGSVGAEAGRLPEAGTLEAKPADGRGAEPGPESGPESGQEPERLPKPAPSTAAE
jgi:LysM repeat protein